MLLACALLTGRLGAKLPELDAVYFGRVFQNTSQLAVPDLGDQVYIVAKLDGVEIARAEMTFGSAQYLLKIPLDDGVNPRLPGTARFGETIRIFLEKDGTQYEPVESQSGLSISSVKGDIQTIDLTFTEDLALNGASSSDAVSLWAGGYGIDPATITNTSDFDNDGATDLEEFTADTDPTDDTSKLQILEQKAASNVYSFRFGPIRVGRVYRILCSETMDEGTYEEITTITVTENAADRWFDHITDLSACFYQIEVEIQ